MRRCIVYGSIIIYGLYQSYHEFNKYLLNIPFEMDLIDFLLYIAVFLYLTIDRLIKELASDYERKKKEFVGNAS